MINAKKETLWSYLSEIEDSTKSNAFVNLKIYIEF